MSRAIRILFVHNALTEFVRLDLEGLRKHFEVTERFERSRAINPIALWRQIKQHDVVFGWFASWHSLLPLEFAKMLGRPSLLVVGGYDVADMPEISYGHQRGGLKKSVSRRAVHTATKVITISDYSRDELARNLGLTNGHARRVFLGVPDKFGGLPNAPRERMALTVGNLNRSNLTRKGHEPFVRAAALLPDVKFVLVGTWQDDAIEYLRSIATSNVEFTGRVADAVLLDHYRKASVYVQPSLHEGFGMSVAEAMLAGCIPVTTAGGALPEVTGEAGERINSAQPSQIAEAVERALAYDDDRRGAIRNRIVQHFPLSQRREQLELLVKSLVAYEE